MAALEHRHKLRRAGDAGCCQGPFHHLELVGALAELPQLGFKPSVKNPNAGLAFLCEWTSPEKVEGFSDSLSKSGERNDQETDRAKTRFR
jgi:hypothetical protein